MKDFYEDEKLFRYAWRYNTLEEFVEKKLEEGKSQQIEIPTGKYRDEKRIVSTYQQKFVEYIRQLSPQVIEELREFVPYFDALLGGQKANYINIFARYKSEIFDLDYSFDGKINNSILKDTFLKYRPEKYKSFRPNKNKPFKPGEYKTYRDDYKWGEHRLMLQFLYLKCVPADEEKRREVRQGMLVLLRDNLAIPYDPLESPKEIDKSLLQKFIIIQSGKILEELLLNEEHNFFCEEAKPKIIKFLEGISPTPETSIEAFVELQIKLLKWAERHNLQKDWLLKYAYLFIWQFSNNPKLKITNIEIPILDVHSLKAYPFGFEFDGWDAGDEDIKDYKRRITESFQSALQRYFQNIGSQSDLRNTKRITKPTDPDFESTKWLIAWNEGATKSEIAEIFNRSTETIKDGIEELLQYALPKRIGTAGRKKHRLVSKERLLEIRKAK